MNKIDKHLASLNITPKLFKLWLTSLPEELLLKSDLKNSWNTYSIIKHLIYGEEVDWIPRLQLMIENRDNESIIFEPFDRGGHDLNNETDIKKLLVDFESKRNENLKILKSIIADHDLEELRGVHPELGPVDGFQLISTWAVHDQTHVYQTARNITSAFVHDIGPWSAYLKIVNQNEYD